MRNVEPKIHMKYVVTRKTPSTANGGGKMERNLQPEVVRVRAVRDSVDTMNYISSSEAKRLLFEIEALKRIIENWADQ